MEKKQYTLAMIETVGAISLWAFSFIFVKIALEEISPVTLIILRYGMGFVILGVAAWFRGDLADLKRSDLRGMALLGLVGVATQQLLQVNGQVTADASVAAFLASMAPAFLVILAAVWLRESIRGWQVFGVLLATLGAGWVATGDDLGSLVQGQLGTPGNWLVLASSVIWAIYTIMTRQLVEDRPPVLITSGMFLSGWIIVLPLFVAQQGWHEIPNLTPKGWMAVFIVGVLSTALAYLLYTHALKLVPATRLAAIQNIEPLIATIAALLILNERVTKALGFGGIAILVGVFLAERNALPESRSESG
jgi:drug/metabolite transporter (DMT)-like permease